MWGGMSSVGGILSENNIIFIYLVFYRWFQMDEPIPSLSFKGQQGELATFGCYTMNKKEYYRRRWERRHRNSMRHMNRRMRLMWEWGVYDWQSSYHRIFLLYPSKNEEVILEDNGCDWWRVKPVPHKYFKNNLCQCSRYCCSGEDYKFKGYRKRRFRY